MWAFAPTATQILMMFQNHTDLSKPGTRAGEEVVQLYIEPAICSFATPIHRLTDFRRVHLAPGQTQTVTFTLANKDIAMLDANFEPRVEPGEFKLRVGSSTTNLRIL